MPIVEIVEHTDHHGICDDYTGSVFARGEKPKRMSRLHYKSLLIGHLLKILHNQAVLKPVLAHLSSLTISYKFIRIKSHIEVQLIGIQGDVEVQVVVNHHLESLAGYAFAFVFIDRFAFDLPLRTPTVSIYASTSAELFKKFRSHLLVNLFWKIAQGILERSYGLFRRKGVSPVRRAADSLFEFRHCWYFSRKEDSFVRFHIYGFCYTFLCQIQ